MEGKGGGVRREEEKEEEDTVRVHEGYRKDTVVYIMDIVGYSGRGGGVKRSGRRRRRERGRGGGEGRRQRSRSRKEEK